MLGLDVTVSTVAIVWFDEVNTGSRRACDVWFDEVNSGSRRACVEEAFVEPRMFLEPYWNERVVIWLMSTLNQVRTLDEVLIEPRRILDCWRKLGPRVEFSWSYIGPMKTCLRSPKLHLRYPLLKKG